MNLYQEPIAIWAQWRINRQAKVMGNHLQSCIEKLDEFGLDVLDVGCQWQEKTPATLADSVGSIAGVLIMLASAFLFWAVFCRLLPHSLGKESRH